MPCNWSKIQTEMDSIYRSTILGISEGYDNGSEASTLYIANSSTNMIPSKKSLYELFLQQPNEWRR